jgi:formylglycine-generating enzyme required for sulfatase activity
VSEATGSPRLPAARDVAGLRGQLLDPDRLHPGLAGRHMLGDVWEWSSSAYLPYPGVPAGGGAVGEYNGNFMSDQRVLQGGSCATPAARAADLPQLSPPPAARWAFAGLRLGRP